MLTRRKRIGFVIALTALAAAALPGAASAEVEWLCLPGQEPDPCRGSLETTVYEPDGASSVENPPLADNPAIDCFYVYPTVSGEGGVNASKDRDPEVMAVARFQAQRFSQRCRAFAPVYRQLTVNSIFTGDAEERAAGAQVAYGDVVEAWREYLNRHNGGRGFVLIGHSQGTFMLRRLIRDEIDRNPQARSRLVSALLLGGNVLVRVGERSGGDFRNLPTCARPEETGCVIAFSAFNETPPENARFGRSPSGDTLGGGFPYGPEYEVACTNPASLAANLPTPLTTLTRSELFPGFLGVGYAIMYGGPPPSAPTPWLQPADRYSGECRSEDGADFLMIEEIGSARRLNPSPDASWGLHLADVNIALGELVQVVTAQESAFLADPPPGCLPRRGRARGKRLGRLRLGRKRRALVAAARAEPERRRPRLLTWCVNGLRGRVGAAFSPRARAVLLAASAPGYRLRRRGGRRTFVLGRGGRRIVGVAAPRLLDRPRLLGRVARRATRP